MNEFTLARLLGTTPRIAAGLLLASITLLIDTPMRGAGNTPVAAGAASGQVSGQLTKWQPVTVDFAGPFATETDTAPHPFLDYRLQVTFTGSGGRTYIVPGFFDGDGTGGGSGTVWRARFTPDQAGT